MNVLAERNCLPMHVGLQPLASGTPNPLQTGRCVGPSDPLLSDDLNSLFLVSEFLGLTVQVASGSMLPICAVSTTGPCRCCVYVLACLRHSLFDALIP